MNHNKSNESEFNKSGDIVVTSEQIEPISVESVIKELNEKAQKQYDDFMNYNVRELNKILNDWTMAYREGIKRVMREMIEKQMFSKTWEFWPDNSLARIIINGLETSSGKVYTYPKGKTKVLTLRRPEITPEEVIEEFIKRFEKNFRGLKIVEFDYQGNRINEIKCLIELNLVI